jgi:uncharacterized protein
MYPTEFPAMAMFLPLVLVAGPALADQQPPVDCSKLLAASVAGQVCRDPGLRALDDSLAKVYAQALQKAAHERPPTLKAEQRGWLKGRDECWKSGDQRACVADSYKRRIAELQARYRLVPIRATVRYACEGQPGSEVLANYFDTDPPVLMAERGDAVSLMYRDISGSGARYVGRNESLWEHQGEASIQWGYGAPTMRCSIER